MSDLVFPDTGLTPGQVYERWSWNGRAWDPLPQTPYVPLAGNVAMTGPIYYTGPFVLGTALVNKDYVDQAVSQLQVFEGAWDAATNTPDLTLVAVPTNGSYYIASSAGTAPAALPGIGGQTVRPGDMVVWQTGPPAEWAIIPGAGMTQAEADVRYLQLAGGTLTGTLTLAGNAAAAPGGNLQPVPLQQLNGALADYVQKAGDTMTGALAITGASGNLSVAGTSTLTGNTTVGGTLGVTGAATLASTLGVTGLSTLAALTSTAVTNLATTSGGATVGSAANNAALEVRGAANLSTFAGATTIGSASNNGAFTARGVVALNSVTGNTTIGYATIAANNGTLSIIANSAACPLNIRNLTTAGGWNEGVRVQRAANMWSLVSVGCEVGSSNGAGGQGDGTFTPDPANPTGPNRLNSNAAWHMHSNVQGDFAISQSNSYRTGGLTALQPVLATTPPDGTAAFYIRRSDNRIFIRDQPLYGQWEDLTFTPAAAISPMVGTFRVRINRVLRLISISCDNFSIPATVTIGGVIGQITIVAGAWFPSGIRRSMMDGDYHNGSGRITINLNYNAGGTVSVYPILPTQMGGPLTVGYNIWGDDMVFMDS